MSRQAGRQHAAKRHIVYIRFNIKLCVAVQPRDGEANKAMREVFSETLKCTKSYVEVIRGMKLRDKTVAIEGVDVKGDERVHLARIRSQLQTAID